MLSDPHWLILIFPLVLLVFYFKPDSKILLTIRIILILTLCLALSNPIVKLLGKEGVVVVVADRSLSMPSDIDKRINETAGILLESMPINSRIGLVSFSDKARIEFSPTKTEITSLSEVQNPDASNLADGIDLALSLIPEGLSGRILVLSDGLWNGDNPQNSAINAISRNIPIDYRYIGRGTVNDLAISYLNVPKLLEPNEPFILRAGINSPLEQEAKIELLNGDKSIFKTDYKLKAGFNEISLNLRAPTSSVAKYVLKVFGSVEDSQLNNNTAQAVSLVKGKKPVLVVSESDNSSIKNLLNVNKIDSVLKNPRKISWQLEDLNSYSAIVLENIMTDSIGFNGMHSLSAWVEHMGGGLLITGGKNSYGNGGYYRSPLDKTFPVSLEMRSEKRKMNIAIAVVLDRSGSMAMQVSGRTKMELADLAAASSLDLLTPEDEFAVFAVDTSPHIVVPLQKVATKSQWRDKILSIRSQGGGIYVYEGINAAVNMLKKANSRTRHIILFSDACDSEKPGEYWNLLDDAERHGITLSVIGLGKETDSDANLLRKIADAGRGRCFFTNEPEDLPRLFSQDTFIAARSTFVDKSVEIGATPEISTYVGNNLDFKSSIGAYNITYIKPNASQIISALDDDNSPILASWQYGLGKVACYMGVMDKELGGDFLKSSYISQVFGGLCNWLAFDDRNALGEIIVTQKIENSVWKAYLNLDPERLKDPFSKTPTVEVITSDAESVPKHYSLKANWENADQLSVSYNIKGNEVINSVLKINDKLKLMLAPACQIYSPEFFSQQDRNGAKELKKLSNMTGGSELIDLNSIWASMPLVYQDKNISNFLFTFALFLFLLEIAERRLALVSIILSAFRKIKNKSTIRTKTEKSFVEPVFEGKTIKKSLSIEPKIQEELIQESEEKENSGSVLSALKKAKKQAGKRM